MWLICFPVVAAGRQQCHTTHLKVFKGVVPTRFFFHCVHLCLSWFLLLQAFARSLQEIQKWADLNVWFAFHLPACSPLRCIFPSRSSLACTGEQEGLLSTQRCNVTPPIPKLPGSWEQTSNKIKLSLISVPENLHEKRRLCITFLVSIKH